MYELQDYERNMLIFMARIVEQTALEYENVDDIMLGGLLLGKRRANLRIREFQVYEDVPFSLSLFCWWPFKPQVRADNREFLVQNRWRLFEGVRQIPFVELSQNQLVAIPFMQAVPDEILSLEMQEMFKMIQEVPLSHLLHL